MEALSIKALVERRGLVFLGVVDLDLRLDFQRFEKWLAEKRHAGMGYLAERAELRRRPETLLPGARSAIIVGLPYSADFSTGRPRTAGYAQYRDYHKVLREEGERITEELRTTFPDADWRAVVDSAPLLERALAAKGGYGFIGKNTCYIHDTAGSFLLLGEILSSAELKSENLAIEGSRCGSCTLCQVECPTGALNTDYQIDSRLCLAYWTIEHRGTIPEKFWPWLAKYWFGCDLCQLACPYNREVQSPASRPGFPRVEIPELYSVATMNEQDYRKYFGGTPLTRAKREGLKRNALIALFVTNDPRFEKALGSVEAERGASPLPETCQQLRVQLQLRRENVSGAVNFI